LRRKDRLWQLFEGHEDLCRKLPYRLWPKQARETPSLLWFSEKLRDGARVSFIAWDLFRDEHGIILSANAPGMLWRNISYTRRERPFLFHKSMIASALLCKEGDWRRNRDVSDDDSAVHLLIAAFVWWVRHHVLLCEFLRNILRGLPVCQNVL
jgi:hypothetical protein